MTTAEQTTTTANTHSGSRRGHRAAKAATAKNTLRVERPVLGSVTLPHPNNSPTSGASLPWPPWRSLNGRSDWPSPPDTSWPPPAATKPSATSETPCKKPNFRSPTNPAISSNKAGLPDRHSEARVAEMNE